jgi:hypothetical protein
MAESVDLELEEVRSLVRSALGEGTAGGHPHDHEFAEYLDRVLDPSEEENFERHVAVCPPCAEELVLLTRSARSENAGRDASAGFWKIAASFLLALGGLLAAALAGRWSGDAIEAGLVASLEAGLSGRASAESASISVLGGPSVEFVGLSLDDPWRTEPFLEARSARFSIDIGQLPRGVVAGGLEIQAPVLNVARLPTGQVNIDALLPTPERLESLLSVATRTSLRSIQIADGTVRVVDESAAQPFEVQLADVDAELSGLGAGEPARLRARAGLESPEHNLAVSGRVGPWGEGVVPRYRLSEVMLDGVPMRSFAGVRDAIRGSLSFVGNLESSGSMWDAVARNVSGEGDLRLVSGSIADANLLAGALGPLVADGDPGDRLAVVFASDDTPFDEIAANVTLRRSTLRAVDVRIASQAFETTGKGRIGREGEVGFEGALRLSPAISSDLVALSPSARRLLDEEGRMVLEVEVTGVWPDLRPRVDLEVLADRLFPVPRFAELFGLPRAG